MNTTLISVRVKAGARKETIEKISEAKFEISVREKPERNQANQRVTKILAARFKVPAAKLRIVKGHHSPSKLFSIESE